MILLAATARDLYRKPRTGMWKELREDLDLDEGDGPDLEFSFFVGDAGGRAARTNAKADHSCVDRYAVACQIVGHHADLKPEIWPQTSASNS